MQASVRLGVIGNGSAAVPVLDSIIANGKFDVMAAVDTEPRARNRFEQRFGVPTCTSVSQLLEHFQLDGVYIATPTKLHEEQTLEVLDAGVNVLVEKPISTTLESALKMIEYAKTRHLSLMVNHKRSVDLPIITMWKLAHDGGLGKVCAVHRLHFKDWIYLPRAIDERDPRTGGVVLRQGAHEFDIIRLLVGSPAIALRGVTGDYDLDRSGEGAYYSWIDHKNGTISTSIYGGYGHFLSDELTMGLGDGAQIGSPKKILESQMTTAEEEIEMKRAAVGTREGGSSAGIYGFTLVNCERGDMRCSPSGAVYVYSDDGRQEVVVDGLSGTEVILDEFYRAIAEHKAPLHDGNWGLACLEQCLAIRESSIRGVAVDLVHQGAISTDAVFNVLGERNLQPV